MVEIEKYIPAFMLDENEPFHITGIGVTVFEETKKSSSFPKRVIEVSDEIACVIEYAIWFDYDIQHLYELEHVWVHIGKDESVKRVEGSFHGKYLIMEDLETGKCKLKNQTHPVVYMQPGKHAVLPDPRLVRLIPDWDLSCNEKAGIDGVLIQDMFAQKIFADGELQENVKKYIKEQFSFVPSLRFYEEKIDEGILCSWDELRDSIPDRVNAQLEIIKSIS